MKNIDALIEKKQKAVDLLKEYKEALAYELCLYDVRQTPGRTSDYMLFEIGTGKEVRNGNASYIRSWLERRGITEEKVYNYEPIRKIEPVEKEDTGLRVNGRITTRLKYY